MKRLAGALAAALMLVLPAPAAAGAGPAWTMADCVEADLISAQPDTSGNWLVVSGSGTSCTLVGSDHGFRIATYLPDRPTGTAEGYNVRLFDKLYAGRLPVREFAAAIARPDPGQYGVCLLAGDDERAGCGLVTVSATDKDMSVTLTPLAVNAPLVARAVVTGAYSGNAGPPLTGGVCATCF